MTDLFPPDSTIRRVSAEPAILLGAGRALLLQLAHPAVAQGVQDHSDFKRAPFKRLQGTLEATFGVVFGSEELAQGIGRRIRWIHGFVTGHLAQQGIAYEANAPENLLWVHATLVDTALRLYEDLVEELTDDDREAYYQEMVVVAEVFGCPRSEQPPTHEAFRAYFDAEVARIEVTDIGRDLGRFILDPSLPLGLHHPLRPGLRVQALLTVGLLPAPLRAQFGFDWDADRQRRYERVLRRTRRLTALTPRTLRTAGTRINTRYLLWLAARHVRRFDEAQARRTGEQEQAAA